MHGKRLVWTTWIVATPLILSGCAWNTSYVDFHAACCRATACIGSFESSADQHGNYSAVSRALVAEGMRLEAENQTSRAIDVYQFAIRRNPKDASAHNALGICSARLGRLPEARQAFYRAVNLRPDERLYRNNLAVVLVDQHQFDAAYSHLVAANGNEVGQHDLLHLLHLVFSQSEHGPSPIETLISQQADNLVQFGPEETDVAEEIDVLDQSELGPDEWLGTPVEVTVPEDFEPTLRLEVRPPRNELPAESARESRRSTLKIITLRESSP